MEQKYPLPTVTDEIRQESYNRLPKEIKDKIESNCVECNQKKQTDGQ